MQIRLWMVALVGLVLNILLAHEIVDNAEFAAGSDKIRHSLGAFQVALDSEFWTMRGLITVACSHGLVCYLDRIKKLDQIRDLAQAVAGISSFILVLLLVADIFLTGIAGQGMQQQVGIHDAPTIMPLVFADIAILAGIGWCFFSTLSSEDGRIYRGGD